MGLYVKWKKQRRTKLAEQEGDLGKSCQSLDDVAILGEMNVPSFSRMSPRDSSAPRCTDRSVNTNRPAG